MIAQAKIINAHVVVDFKPGTTEQIMVDIAPELTHCAILEPLEARSMREPGP
jgi:hypothetical protein